jgi:hypothetical protein
MVAKDSATYCNLLDEIHFAYGRRSAIAYSVSFICCKSWDAQLVLFHTPDLRRFPVGIFRTLRVFILDLPAY